MATQKSSTSTKQIGTELKLIRVDSIDLRERTMSSTIQLMRDQQVFNTYLVHL